MNADNLELVKKWADHAADAFRGLKRSKDIENMIKSTLTLAVTYACSVHPTQIDMWRNAVVSYSWNEDNEILVRVNDEIVPGALVWRGSGCVGVQ